MKTFTYTTLLFSTITLLALPCYSQNTQHDGMYLNANQTHVNVGVLRNKNIALAPGIKIDTVSVAKLGAVLNNMAGVIDIIQGGKSLMHPNLMQASSADFTIAEALNNCAEAGKALEIGKAEPTPDVEGIPVVRKKGQELIGPEGVVLKNNISSNTGRTPSKDIISASAGSSASSPFQHLLDAELTNTASTVRAARVVPVELSYQIFLKKYSIVLGTFKSLNNADFVRRTFNSLGERAIVVENGAGMYHTLLAGTDNEGEAIQKLDNFDKKYKAGFSRTRLIKKFGVPLDDLWILKNE